MSAAFVTSPPRGDVDPVRLDPDALSLHQPLSCGVDQAKDLEIAVLRHQSKVLRRQVVRPRFRLIDRAMLAAAARELPRERWGSFLTLLRWHRELV